MVDAKRKVRVETHKVTTWEFECDFCGTVVEKHYEPTQTLCDKCARTQNRDGWLLEHQYIFGAKIVNVELDSYYQDQLVAVELKTEDGRHFRIVPCCGYPEAPRDELEIMEGEDDD